MRRKINEQNEIIGNNQHEFPLFGFHSDDPKSRKRIDYLFSNSL